jgi:hypothetical protein
MGYIDGVCIGAVHEREKLRELFCSKKLQLVAGICVFVAKSYNYNYKIVRFPGRNVSAKDAVPGKVI